MSPAHPTSRLQPAGYTGNSTIKRTQNVAAKVAAQRLAKVMAQTAADDEDEDDDLGFRFAAPPPPAPPSTAAAIPSISVSRANRSPSPAVFFFQQPAFVTLDLRVCIIVISMICHQVLGYGIFLVLFCMKYFWMLNANLFLGFCCKYGWWCDG